MSLQEQLDLTDQTAESIETGNRVEAGWKRLKIEDVYEDRQKETIKFKMKVTIGEDEGKALIESLTHPSQAQDSQGANFARQRRNLFAKRLGLIPPESYGGHAPVNWLDAIGLEVVGRVAHREGEKTNPVTGKREKTGQTFVSLTFDGIYPFHHEKIPADVRKELQLDEPGNTTTTPIAPTAHGTAAGSQPATNAPAQRQLIPTPARNAYDDLDV